MPITTQIKLLRAARQILQGHGRQALAGGSEAKPTFLFGKVAQFLPRSSPERQGLSSHALARFYAEIAAAPKANLHSLLVARGGQVVAEGTFAPFRPDIWHVSHSLSKSFVGAAVGLAIGEGLFGLDDKILDHFPAFRTLGTGRRMRAVTVRHLLTMSSGISFNELSEAVETEWLRGIFSSPVAFEPGSRFVYNSMNSYLLSALVCRAAGTSLMDYLTPRLFQPMGFGPVAWEKSPEGYEKGGWGMYLMVEDMAKFGQLHLQGGRWQVQGKTVQLLPESWVSQATAVQMTSDKGEGYGFQMWIDVPTGSFIMNGMFGQYVIGMPGLDILLTMTGGNPRLFTDSEAFSVVERHFFHLGALPARLPESPAACAALRRTLAGLRFRAPAPATAPPARRLPPANRSRRWQAARRVQQAALPAGAAAFCGATWQFPQNQAGFLPIIVQAMNNNFAFGVQALRLEAEPEGLALFWEEGNGTICLPVGFGQARLRKVIIGAETFLVAASARLAANEDDEDVLVLEICLLEHSSFRIAKLRRMGEGIELRLDEEPQFMLAIESAINQSSATGAPVAGRYGTLAEGITGGSGTTSARIEHLCQPRLIGTPVHRAAGDP